MAHSTQFRGYGPATLAATGVIAFLAASVQSIWLPDPANHISAYLSIWISTAILSAALTGVQMYTGASWTTDAPFRETEAMIEACRANGILAVEMEAAALYALAAAQQRDIICFAHVTNQMAKDGEDFEKGPDQGSHAALQAIGWTAHNWLQWRADQQRACART